MRRRRGLCTALLGTAGLLAGVLSSGSAAAADTTACTTTPSTTQAGYAVADPACAYNGTAYTGGRFEPLTDAGGAAVSRTYTGIHRGAAYRMEVPLNWNHQLVLFAHGYRGTGSTVYVSDPDLRAYYIARGYAWAASSYATNGYDVGRGVTDTHVLLPMFTHRFGKPSQVIMSGLSMGGQITAVEIEHYRGDFAGAMPYCGALGDARLFDYFLDANATAAAVTSTPISYPTSLTAGLAYTPTYAAQVAAELPRLGSGFTTGDPTKVTLSTAGVLWRDAVEQRSGGSRPGFASAFAYWASFGYAPLATAPFLFGVYPGLSGGTLGVAPGNLAGNAGTTYQLDGDPAVSDVEQALNRDVLRVAATASPSYGLTGLPVVKGDPRIPVLSLHGIGDLFVPFSMEQVYAQRVAKRGESSLFVSRAVREVGHCDFTQNELRSGFDDLTTWIGTGTKPAGSDVLDPAAVASPTFGCEFTDPSPTAHRAFFGAACPAKDPAGQVSG